jgi:hypothetical protein
LFDDEKESVVAVKDVFTDDEWKTLQWALLNAGGHISASDWPGLWKGFKEAAGGSEFLTKLQKSDDELVRALSKDQARKGDPNTNGRADLASDVALQRIREAVALVEAKAPEHLDAFKAMLLGVATAMAAAVDGTSEKESAAIDRIREALDGPAEG